MRKSGTSSVLRGEGSLHMATAVMVGLCVQWG